MRRHRIDLWASARTFLTSLLARAQELMKQSARLRIQYGDQPAIEPTISELEAARRIFYTDITPVASAENKFLLYWTLLVSPWPGRVAVAGAAQPTARTFGMLFDAIELPNSRIRALSNDWADWAEKEIIAVAKVRLAALEARGTTA